MTGRRRLQELRRAACLFPVWVEGYRPSAPRLPEKVRALGPKAFTISRARHALCPPHGERSEHHDSREDAAANLHLMLNASRRASSRVSLRPLNFCSIAVSRASCGLDRRQCVMPAS